MRVAIVGYGLEGQESARYWHGLGDQITICDKDTNLDTANTDFKYRLGDDYLENLSDFDIVVRTAGMHPDLIVNANTEKILDKITSSVNEFFRVCPSKNIIGVTGTKGKGTTSTLISKILEASGKTVHLGGNIGIPALELLPKISPDSWVVLELSSFQLMDVKCSPSIAICLMVVAEHLDWHKDLSEYLAAKSNLFKYQKSDNVAIYNLNSPFSDKVTGISKGLRKPYDVPELNREPKNKQFAYVLGDNIYYGSQEICSIYEVKLRGRHNLENICAAINAIWEIINGDVAIIKKIASTFAGLEHRIELVREVDGVSYYNDSFATTPETAIACIRAFPDVGKILILGGSDKGVPFYSLADEVVNSKVKHAFIIGDTAKTIAKLLEEKGFSSFTLGKSTMPEIVEAAKEYAEPGDVVLLSTGCASFGLFKDYKDRGNQFKQAVNSL